MNYFLLKKFFEIKKHAGITLRVKKSYSFSLNDWSKNPVPE